MSHNDSSIGGRHGVHETAQCRAEEHQKGREGCQEEKDDLETAEEDAHRAWQTGSEGGKAEATSVVLALDVYRCPNCRWVEFFDLDMSLPER
jgi:hypothetical protein